MKKELSRVRNITKTIQQVGQQAKKPVRILLASEEESITAGLVQRLIDGGGSPAIFTTLDLSESLSSEEMTERVAGVDAVLILLDGTKPVSQPVSSFVSLLRGGSFQEDSYPLLVVVDKVELADTKKLADELSSLNISEKDIIFISTGLNVGLEDELAPRLAELCSDKEISLSAKLPFLRKAVAERIIKRTAWQNGLVGVITFLPGADMPVLTANQIKMILELAAAYGVKLNFERAKEILVVVGGGFTLRAIARQLLDFVPGPGWIVKGGVAYSGTIALGKAAQQYFERGLAEISWPGKKTVRDDIKAMVKNRTYSTRS